MAQRLNPARSNPCAPVTRMVWPLILSDPSGVEEGRPSSAAARSNASTTASLEHASPTAFGKSGRSGAGTPPRKRAGNCRARNAT